MRRIVLFGFTLLVGAACIGLGIWQLRRLSARRAANRGALTSRNLPELLVQGPALNLSSNRRARIRGRLDEGRELLLRGRAVQGVPAVVVVTPLRIEGNDTAVLINRGYVPAADAVDPGPVNWSESDRQEFHGVVLPVPDRGDGAPLEHAGRQTWKTLDLTAMRGQLPYPVAPYYVVAEPDPAQGEAHTIRGLVYPFRAEPPPLSEGPHLMYAVQWFGIAAAVVAFGVIFVWRGVSYRSPDA